MLWLVYWCACLATLAWATTFAGQWIDTGPAALIAFLGLLPLVNVVWDWVSLEITRGLLAASLVGGRLRALACSALDLGGAIVCLTLLAITTAAAIEAFNLLAVRSGGKPLLELQAVLEGVREDPGAVMYWWIYVMLFSTFVPTLAHAGIAATSLAWRSIGATRRRQIADWIESGGDLGERNTLRRKAARAIFWLGVAGWGTTAVAFAALAVLGAAGFLWLPALAEWLHWVASETARLVRALDGHV